MSYATQDTSAADPTFRQQVRQPLFAQAAVVVAESGTVTNHTNRVAYACSTARMLTDDALTTIARLTVNDGTTGPGASDATVLARIAALWDTLAGTSSEPP